MSGIWVEEGFYECGEYLTKKPFSKKVSSTKTDAKPRKNKKIKSRLEMEKNIFLVQIAKKHEASFPTLLGHVIQ